MFFSLILAILSIDITAVVECKIPAFTGTSGVVIRETAETFGIVTKDDKFRGNSSIWILNLLHFPWSKPICLCESIKFHEFAQVFLTNDHGYFFVWWFWFAVVPKKSSVFIFQWDCWKVTLLGDKLSSRIPSLPSSNWFQQMIYKNNTLYNNI